MTSCVSGNYSDARQPCLYWHCPCNSSTIILIRGKTNTTQSPPLAGNQPGFGPASCKTGNTRSVFATHTPTHQSRLRPGYPRTSRPSALRPRKPAWLTITSSATSARCRPLRKPQPHGSPLDAASIIYGCRNSSTPCVNLKIEDGGHLPDHVVEFLVITRFHEVIGRS